MFLLSRLVPCWQSSWRRRSRSRHIEPFIMIALFLGITSCNISRNSSPPSPESLFLKPFVIFVPFLCPVSGQELSLERSSIMNVYEISNTRITELLESGTVPWHKQRNGSSSMPKNIASKKECRGVNLFLLALQCSILEVNT